MKSVLVLLAAMFSVLTSAFAQSNSSGLTGLGEMRTPEVIPDNGAQITLVPGRYSRLSGNGSIESRVAPSLGFTQGWGEKLEAGIQIPFYFHDEDSGLGNITLATKVKSPRKLWKTDFALSGGVELPSGSRQSKYGSGTPGFGLDVLGSVPVSVPVVPDVTLVGSFGYGTSDYCPRCTVPGAQIQKPRSLAVVRASGGASIDVLQHFSAFGELHALKANNGSPQGEYSGDPDLYTIVGARAAFLGRYGVTAYGGVGLYEGSNTDIVGAVMLHYSFSSGLGPKPSVTP